jgi:hypothetical protein
MEAVMTDHTLGRNDVPVRYLIQRLLSRALMLDEAMPSDVIADVPL